MYVIDSVMTFEALGEDSSSLKRTCVIEIDFEKKVTTAFIGQKIPFMESCFATVVALTWICCLHFVVSVQPPWIKTTIFIFSANHVEPINSGSGAVHLKRKN